MTTVRNRRAQRRRLGTGVAWGFTVDGVALARAARLQRMVQAAIAERAMLAHVQGHARMAAIWSKQAATNKEIESCSSS